MGGWTGGGGTLSFATQRPAHQEGQGRGQGQIPLNKAQLSPEGLTDLIPRQLASRSPVSLMAVCSRDFPVGVRPLSVELRVGRASKGLPGPTDHLTVPSWYPRIPGTIHNLKEHYVHGGHRG